jgi:cupin fold WbuC family metalloprotein
VYIYSLKNKKKILGVIHRYKNISVKRENISPINEFLQVSAQKLKKNDVVEPHIHIKNNKKITITQEIWIVLRGEVLIQIHDIDKKKIKAFKLLKGDMYVLFRGGHTFRVLSKEAIFYEIKNGPYNQKIKDIKYFKE